MGEKGNFLDKILDFLGLNGEVKTKKNTARLKNNKNSKVVSLEDRKNEFKVVYHIPDSLSETKEIVDDLKNGRAIIVNLEEKDHNNARRFIDFISGAVYGLNGNIQKIGSGVFLFTPSNIEIDGKKLEENIRQEFFNQQ
ncbi:MAG: cell division protein SepF [Bacillota bacterium]